MWRAVLKKELEMRKIWRLAWTRWVGWRCACIMRIHPHAPEKNKSPSKMVKVALHYMKWFPYSFREIKFAPVVNAYLHAVHEGQIEDANKIARALKNRPSWHFSIIQHRMFETHVFRQVATIAPDGAKAREVLEALVGMGYRVKPDVLLAAVLLTENLTPAYAPVSGDKALEDQAQRLKPSRLRVFAGEQTRIKRERTIAAGRDTLRKRYRTAAGK